MPGTAALLARCPDTFRQALMHNLKHDNVLHQRAVLVTMTTTGAPEKPRQMGRRWSSYRTA